MNNTIDEQVQREIDRVKQIPGFKPLIAREEITEVVDKLKLSNDKRIAATRFLELIGEEAMLEDYYHSGGESFFRRRFDFIKKLPQESIDLLIGDFWELQFCRLVSTWGYYTHRFQKWKEHGSARAGRGSIRVREEIQLPDILLLGNGFVCMCDIKHNRPRQGYADFGIDEGSLKGWRQLIELYPLIPIFFVLHSYLPLDRCDHDDESWRDYWEEHRIEYNHADRWSFGFNDEKDWIGIQFSSGIKLREEYYIKLEEFRPLKELLEVHRNQCQTRE